MKTVRQFAMPMAIAVAIAVFLNLILEVTYNWIITAL